MYVCLFNRCSVMDVHGFRHGFSLGIGLWFES
nr:MAG TPA: hypothetical protein [Caudoviricetes sp.]